MAKTKTNKALLITSIVLTVIMLVGLVFSLTLWQAVENLLHPETAQNENGEETDAADQAGRAIAAVFVGILLIPVWILAELITLALDIPSLVMSSTLCGRLVHDRKLAKQSDSAMAEQSDGEMPEQYETVEPEQAPAPKRGKGMLIASIVLIVLNVAALATLVITTLAVIL